MCGKFDRHSVKISVYCYFSTAFYSDQQIFDLRLVSHSLATYHSNPCRQTGDDMTVKFFSSPFVQILKRQLCCYKMWLPIYNLVYFSSAGFNTL